MKHLFDPEDHRLTAFERQVMRNAMARIYGTPLPPEDYRRRAEQMFRLQDGDPPTDAA